MHSIHTYNVIAAPEVDWYHEIREWAKVIGQILLVGAVVACVVLMIVTK